MKETVNTEFRLIWCVMHAVLITGVLIILAIVNL